MSWQPKVREPPRMEGKRPEGEEVQKGKYLVQEALIWIIHVS